MPPASSGYTYAGDPLWTDYLFDVDITFGTGITAFYVSVRGDPTSSLGPNGGRQYLFTVDGDSDAIRLRYTIEPSTFINVEGMPYTLTDQTTYHIQVGIVGATMTAFIDGNAVLDHTFSGSEPS